MKIIKRFTNFFAAIVVMIMSFVPAQLAFADSNKLYITPDSSQMNVGTSFTINVKSYAATSQANGTVSGKVLYTSNLLTATSVSTGGSGYTMSNVNTATAGVVTFSGSQTPGNSGLSQIFAITFQANAAGTATVGFDGTSQVNGVTTTYATSTFTVTAPASSPSPSPSSSTSSQPKASSSPTPAPVVTTPVQATASTSPNTDQVVSTPDPSGVIDTVVVTPSYTSATITWKVNAQNPTSSIVFGSDSSQLTKSAPAKKQADGSFSATITGLTPGQRYYFSISGGGSNVATGTYSSTIPTQGYPVIISVTENNVSASGAQVQIGAASYNTQPNGKVTVGLAAGSYSGKITTDTATLNINLTVANKTIPSDGSAPAAQDLGFNLISSPLDSGPGSGLTIFTFVGVLIAGTVVIVFGFLIFINYRRHKFESGTDNYAMSTSPTVVVEDGYDWRQETVKSPEAYAASPPLPPITSTQPHANSVYISDEQPLDMFEQAKLHETIVSPIVKPVSGTPQSPNSLHSTMP